MDTKLKISEIGKTPKKRRKISNDKKKRRNSLAHSVWACNFAHFTCALLFRQVFFLNIFSFPSRSLCAADAITISILPETHICWWALFWFRSLSLSLSLCLQYVRAPLSTAEATVKPKSAVFLGLLICARFSMRSANRPPPPHPLGQLSRSWAPAIRSWLHKYKSTRTSVLWGYAAVFSGALLRDGN